MEALLAWAEECGVELQNLQFKLTESRGWGAYPLSPSPTSSSIHLPLDSIITPEIARKLFPDAKASNTILMKTLVAFYSMNEGPYKPYFDLLPKINDIPSPLILSEEDLKVYKNTNLNENAVRLKKEHIKNEWTHVKDTVSLERYLYGHLIISSRSFPYKIINPKAQESDVMLLPLVDLLNHKSRAKVDWKYEKSGFTLTTEANPDSENEIFNNYGPKGNEELLMGYGFVIEDNEFDLLHLTLALSSEIKAKVEKLGIQLTNFNDYTTINANSSSNQVVFITNNFHPLPRGLLESFALSASDANEINLFNVLVGIKELKDMLKLKFKGSLDVIPKKPAAMKEEYYKTAVIYRKGQLKMYNLLMHTIKQLERKLLKSNKEHLKKVNYEEDQTESKFILDRGSEKSPLLIDPIFIDSSDWY